MDARVSPQRPGRPGRDRRKPRQSRRRTRRAAGATSAQRVADQLAALAEFQGQPARLLVALDHLPILFIVSLFAEFIANDKPFMIRLDGKFYFPAIVSYSETTFGGEFETAADYRDPYLQKLIAEKGGSIWWPPIRYSYSTHNLDLPTPAPSQPTWMLTEKRNAHPSSSARA